MVRRLIVPVIALALIASISFAEDAPFGIAKDDTIRTVLAAQTGQRVTLKLTSTEELTGKVQSVGQHVVHLSELAGKEYYDAVVDLEKVTAVVVRARGK